MNKQIDKGDKLVKEIILNNGDVVTVDDEDYEAVINYDWWFTDGYKGAVNKNDITLGGFIATRMGLKFTPNLVGHRNLNCHDNTRANIYIKKIIGGDTVYLRVKKCIFVVVYPVIISQPRFTIALTILPINSMYEPHKTFLPFDVLVKPPETLLSIRNNSKEVWIINKAIDEGLDKSEAIDLFEKWCANLYIDSDHRLAPLAYDWPVTKDSLIEILGYTHYSLSFNDKEYRDAKQSFNFVVDRAEYQGTSTFKGLRRKFIRFENDENIRKDRIIHCIKIAEAYKELLRSFY